MNPTFPNKGIPPIKGIPLKAKGSQWNYSLFTNMMANKELFNLHFPMAPVATYPSAGGQRGGSRVCLPREEDARSRHQCLFEENVGKTEKVWSTNFNRERFRSCFYARGRYQHPTCPSQGTIAFNQVCNIMSSICFIFPFVRFYVFLCVFFLSFCGRQGCFPRSYVSSIAMRKSDLRSSLRTKHLVKLFFIFFMRYILTEQKVI